MGFSQALSGLNAAASNLNVVSNNIANSQTVGFKSASTQFADVYASAKIGLGVTVADVVQDFGSGNLETTGRGLDLAISGDGFFKFQQAGQVVYSRNGQLTMTPDGYLENAQGARLMGAETALQVPSGQMPAMATTELKSVYNLKADSAVPTKTPFDPADSATFNYASTSTVYDSLGNTHQLTNYFVKSGLSQWQVYAALDGKDITPKDVAGDPAPPVITFTTNGTFPIAPDSADAAKYPAGTADPAYVADLAAYDAIKYTPSVFTVSAADLNNGAADLEVTLNLTGSTQFGNDFDQSSLTQNGYTAGSLVGITIDKSGNVVGNYSNEQKQTVGALSMVIFRTPEGLQSVGDNAWVETAASGQPLSGVAGTGRFGSVYAGVLESSNVDLTKELVNLIIAQRNYQANAQSVKTQSDALEQAVNLS